MAKTEVVFLMFVLAIAAFTSEAHVGLDDTTIPDTIIPESQEDLPEALLHHTELLQNILKTSLSGKPNQNLHSLPGYAAGDHPHPKLLEAASKTPLLKAHEVFLNKDVPMTAILGHPVGKVSCAKVAKADEVHAEKVEVSMIDLSHKKGSLFQSRKLSAEFLAAPDHNAHKNARTVLIRGYRHLKSDTPIAFPDAEFVPAHLRGLTVDPKADVLLEMTSNGLSGDHCEYYLRHHREGVQALSSVLDLDDRAHLKPLIHTFAKDFAAKFDAHTKVNKGTHSFDISAKEAEDQITKLFTQAHQSLEAKKREAKARKDKAFGVFMDDVGEQKQAEADKEPDLNLDQMQSHRRRLSPLAQQFANFEYTKKTNLQQCVTEAEENNKMQPLTARQVKYAYKKAQQDILGVTNWCADTPHGRMAWDIDAPGKDGMVDGSVQAQYGATVTAGVAFVPDVRFNSRWYPICGHFFWNNNDGATTVCQGLGFSSGTCQRVGNTYSIDSMPVGSCRPGQALNSCNDGQYGGNGWGNLEYGGGFCKGGSGPGITVTCSFGEELIQVPEDRENQAAAPKEASGVEQIQAAAPKEASGVEQIQAAAPKEASRVEQIQAATSKEASGVEQIQAAAPKEASGAKRKMLGSGFSDSRRRFSDSRRRHCQAPAFPSVHKTLPYFYKPTALGLGGVTPEGTQKQFSDEHKKMLEACCTCIANMAGVEYSDKPLKEAFDGFSAQNPAGSDTALKSGCLSPVCYTNKAERRRTSQYIYKDPATHKITSTDNYGRKANDALPVEIYRANNCDQAGSNWCGGRRRVSGCLAAHIDPQCINCACVPECTSWVAEQYGPDHHLKEMATKCSSEDGQDFGCVEKNLAGTFCIGDSCKCWGLKNCDPVARVLLAFIAFVGDMLLGCALGFVAQPSFWINILGDDKQTANYQGVKTGVDQIRAMDGVPTDAQLGVADQDIAEGLDKRRNAVQAERGGSLPAKPASSTVNSVAVDSVSSMKTNTPMKLGTMKNMMKKGLKNCLPCLVTVLAGLMGAWVPGFGALAISAAATAFFGCMKGCVIVSFGMAMGFLVFDLVTGCLWEIMGKAVGAALGGCFPADATVELKDGRQVAMKDLQVGDVVRSSANSFSEVYVFSHQLLSTETAFVKISVESGNSLELSPTHFIPVSPACDGTMEMMHASDAKVGSCVLSGRSDMLKQSKIVSHDIIISKGLYNPFTKSGDIVVDGILASSHSEWFLDDLASKLGGLSFLPSVYQVVMAPARFLYNLVGPEIARNELEKYQEKLNSYTDDGAVLAPFWDLGWRTIEILSGRP